MTVKLWSNVPQQFFDDDGAPLAGGQLFFYAAGSSTKQNTYTTSAGNVANSNPITLDSAGRLPNEVWLTAGLSYKAVLTASTDTDPPASPLETWDNIAGINDASLTLDEWITGPSPTYVSATSFTLVGDQTTIFHVGRRVKTTNTGGEVYSYITASAFATLTTITVVNDSGSLDSGLSAVSYGLDSSTNPSNPLLTDTYPIVSGSADKTKKVRLEADGLTTATTRVLTVQDEDGTIALTSEFAYSTVNASPGRLPLPRGHLAGGTLSNNSSDATNDIDIAEGQARDSTNAANLIWSALTKQLDASWAAGTNAGGLDTGSIANGTYHVFAIKKDTDGTGDVLFSASATAPTMPTGYTYFRRIGSILRESAAIVAFTQVGNEFLRTTPVSDFSGTQTTTSTLRALSVPLGLKVRAILTFRAFTSDSNLESFAAWIRSPDQADDAASNTNATVRTGNSSSASSPDGDSAMVQIRTNTSAQVRTRSTVNNAACIISGFTYGWMDDRGIYD